MGKKSQWIDVSQRRPDAGQFVRVEVSERVENHWLHFEGQARYDADGKWLTADGAPYLSESQEIRRWKPLIDSGDHQEWEDFLGDLAKD